MKLLWLNHRDPANPEAGGAEVRIHEIGKRLVEKGIIVDLVCERWHGGKPSDNIDGIRIIRMGGRIGVHIEAPFWLMKVRNYDAIIDDVAHAVPWFSPFFTQKPVLAQVHHVHQKVLNWELASYFVKPVALFERDLRFIYKAFIAVSESTKNELVAQLKIPPDRIKVVPNGVNGVQMVAPKNPAPTISWIGRVRRYKRLENLVFAFKRVQANIPSARLIVIGDGEHLPIMKRLVSDLGLHNVVFLGKVSEEEKFNLIGSSWVTASTSIVEGWGLTISEAAACGVPAVAYNVPGLRDSIVDKKTGILVTDGDVNKLAGALTELLNEESLRKTLGKSARDYAKRISWDTAANRFLEVLETEIAFRKKGD